MLADSDRLLDLIEQVLRAGRSRQRLLHQSRLDLRSLVRDSVDLARAASSPARRSAHLRRARRRRGDGDGDGRCRRAEGRRLEPDRQRHQVLRRRRCTCEVELLALDPRRVAVRVRDRGIGISKPELKRIFRRFYRIPEAVAMRVKGSGLGLFIVSSVARKHGGRVLGRKRRPRPGQHLHACSCRLRPTHDTHPDRRRRAAPGRRAALQPGGRVLRHRGRGQRRGGARPPARRPIRRST